MLSAPLELLTDSFSDEEEEEEPDVLPEEAPEEVRTLADQRWQAKQNRDWTEADRLRAEVAALGWVIKDRKDGYDLARK